MAGRINQLDREIGERIKQARVATRFSQKRLADEVGVTFQQIQKYEIGVNRVSASRLWQIAQALNLPITFFFDSDQSPFLASPLDSIKDDDSRSTIVRLIDILSNTPN